MLALVVDDEAAIVALLADLLIQEGHHVVTAVDGRAALCKLQNGLRPQLVISDIMMPHLDGLALYMAMRNELQLGEVGVILMSAGRSTPAFKNDRAARFLAKPFNVDEVLHVMDELCPAG
ncbi:MAG: response regulator [Herpetosiphon sp.]